MKRKITSTALLALLSLGILAPAVNAGNWNSCTHWAEKKFGYYGVRNNTWGSGNQGFGWQCMWASWGTGWQVFGVECDHNNGTGQVKGYPQIVRGWSRGDGFRLSNNHGMGVKFTNLWEAKVKWKFSAPNSGRHISLIDIYLHWWHTPGNNQLPVLNLQIYTHVNDWQGWLTNENNISGTYRGTRWIGGVQYKAWTNWNHPDGNLAAERLFHVRPVGWKKNATHDVKGILQWGKDLGIVHNNMYLTSIQAGWEPIDGRLSFSTQQYWTKVNGY